MQTFTCLDAALTQKEKACSGNSLKKELEKSEKFDSQKKWEP